MCRKLKQKQVGEGGDPEASPTQTTRVRLGLSCRKLQYDSHPVSIITRSSNQKRTRPGILKRQPQRTDH